MDKNKELTQLSEAFASLDKGFKELRASSPEEDKYNKIWDSMYEMMRNIHDRIDKTQNNMYDLYSRHMENNTHLPKLSPSQQNALLKAAGADKDYEVPKKYIYSSIASKKGVEVELKLSENK